MSQHPPREEISSELHHIYIIITSYLHHNYIMISEFGIATGRVIVHPLHMYNARSIIDKKKPEVCLSMAVVICAYIYTLYCVQHKQKEKLI